MSVHTSFQKSWYFSILLFARKLFLVASFLSLKFLHRASHTAHNIATSEMSAFDAGFLKRGSNCRFFAVQELLSAIMIILLGKEGVVLELAPVLSRKRIILKPKLPLFHPFIIVLRRNEHVDPPFFTGFIYS